MVPGRMDPVKAYPWRGGQTLLDEGHGLDFNGKLVSLNQIATAAAVAVRLDTDRAIGQELEGVLVRSVHDEAVVVGLEKLFPLPHHPNQIDPPTVLRTAALA